MEIVVNMFVALCVGVSYVVGYLLAVLSLVFLIAWIIDDKYKTNLSSIAFNLFRQYFPDKDEKVLCARCENAENIGLDVSEDNYCSSCGKELKKHKASAYDIRVENMTKKVLLFALSAAVFYTISTALFGVFVIISIGLYCFYSFSGSVASKGEPS